LFIPCPGPFVFEISAAATANIILFKRHGQSAEVWQQTDPKRSAAKRFTFIADQAALSSRFCAFY